jgi:hypothetical protein
VTDIYPPARLDANTLRIIVATRGLDLDLTEAAEVVAMVRNARTVLAALAAELAADDGIHAFRSVLQSELTR